VCSKFVVVQASKQFHRAIDNSSKRRRKNSKTVMESDALWQYIGSTFPGLKHGVIEKALIPTKSVSKMIPLIIFSYF
jgi:hypothetical protein